MRRRVILAIAAAAALGGSLAALRYAAGGLTLAHYDARGHLVVARRILDSITPGWQQIGAVWLPLPHLLNAVPVQVDRFFTTGASAVAMSVIAYAAATAAIAWIVVAVTGSLAAGAAAAAVFALNPNVVYLQATPMTEPLLLALITASVALLLSWSARVTLERDDAPFLVRGAADSHALSLTAPSDAVVGWTLVLACMTRYEAWPVTFSALAATAWVLWRGNVPGRRALRRIGAVAIYPAAAIVGFTIFSRVVVGAWFASGFFVPDNPAQGHPELAIRQIAWGLRELTGAGVLAFAVAGAALLSGRGLLTRGEASFAIPLALATTAAVPWTAFLAGHPYRIRYVVPLIAAQAVFAGAAAGVWRRSAPLLALVLAGFALFELHPMDRLAPMVVEAQWDRPNATGRERVTACLSEHYSGETIMASMGSLGHYMQELSRAGFSLRDFLHEGNGDIWLGALDSPRPFVGWILIEEHAEGGDMLAAIAREHPRFLEGFSRICEGGGLALYRRN